MRVTLRSGGMLLVLGAFLTGCEQPANSPQKGTSGPPANSGPAVTKTAETDYVLGISGMS